MKKETIFFVFTCLIWYCNSSITPFTIITTPVDPRVQRRAANQVLARLLKPYMSAVFDITIAPVPHFINDGFHIVKTEKDNYVRVTAPNGVSAVWGVFYYLKNYCNCHISWDGDQLRLPYNYPEVDIAIQAKDKYRFYQNPVASSYSYIWWDWKRWEREIDWMALNGINLALAFTAQEAIWKRVYDGFGLSKNDFTGAALLAWYRMGNVKKFGTGLPKGWHREKINIQHKILKRMRELGIIPVLPGFCGVVPTSMMQFYPGATSQKLPKWGKFPDEYCCPYFLHPRDPLFTIISQVYYREYMNEFGGSNIYSCDIYNENKPATSNEHYLRSVSSGIFQAMQLVNPLAVWMMQGWMFNDLFWQNKDAVKAFLEAVPIGKLVILDLQADLTPQYDRLSNFFGHAFIWCTLHNFGGQLGIYGHLGKINKELTKARISQPPTMVGIGIVPEGIDQNYIIYDFTLDWATRMFPPNLTEWVSKYALRRYGKYNQNVDEAWQLLKDTAYNFDPSTVKRETVNETKSTKLEKGEHMSKNIMTKLPTLKLNELSWYNKSDMFIVLKKFVAASKDNKINFLPTFKHDLVDVARQNAQLAVSSFYFKLIEAFTLKEYDDFQHAAKLILRIFEDIDVVLATEKKLLIGAWLYDAYQWGDSTPEVRNYSFEARNQITLWGPNGEMRDYAAKQWSGMMVDFYKKRWEVFIHALNDSLTGKASYDAEATKKKIFLTVEKPFVESLKNYPRRPDGDPVKVVQSFYKRWGPIFYEIFKSRDNKTEVKWDRLIYRVELLRRFKNFKR